ncbi:LOW QUALITY PROTEIN: beta-1,4-N-acetylgalactosaminyltransferase 3 [Pristis pectinata]|uniref:LOW QUALITY PROTEIN: beta-1,4-N-acetylgalactosaminyltransferase 3 n=1 Tax=Pristis pectinata TaxID=685728 RepID=UPI00223DC79F|nr:LOW QUALITY PROTEIN: beta-1,4-N-acetylgalactosaminyltransferase 3 [Pristis pectinata]
MRMMLLFPVKKIRKHFKVLVFVVILGIGVWAAYLEFVASSEWRRSGAYKPHREFSNWRKQLYGQRNKVPGVDRDLEYYNQRKDDAVNELVGQANLHIFEDWCGGSVDQLRKNIHFPLFPHTRTVVKKLAVAPRWTNYGLRIFGYIHPYAESAFQFAVASDDNSEFWLSADDNPSNVTLLARVGKTGKEWTAPGEFGKFQSQISNPVQLSSSRRYYFEVLHKAKAKGTDHVEVAWRLHNTGLKFNIIDSQYISLYINESLIKLNEVQHIPQSAASYKKNYRYLHSQNEHPAEMLKHDPRDSFFHLPLIAESHVHSVLPDCAYRPSYVIKGFPLLRYQGLQFVHLTYVYPNDYTRLTHMESENKCFYFENVYYLERFGFYKYMKMDVPPQKSNGGKSGNSLWIGAGDGKPNEQNRNKEEGLEHNVEVEEEEYNYEEDDQFPQPANQKDALQEQSQKNIEEVGSQKEKADSIREAKHPPNLHNRVNDVTLKDYGDDYDDYTFKRKRKLFFVVENKPSNDTVDHNTVVDHRLAEKVLAHKGMKSKRNEISSVKEDIQSTHSPSQKTNRTFQGFSKQKYVSLNDGLGDLTVKSSVRQKAKGNNFSTQQISQGKNLDINQNIGRLEFQERQVHGLVEKQKEMVIQKAKRTTYDQQPPTLSGQKVNKNDVAFINKKDSKGRTDRLKRRELKSPSKLKEETFDADRQINGSNKSVLGQNNKLNNLAENPGPSVPVQSHSRKETQSIKMKDQYEKVISFANQKWKEKEYDYIEQENDPVIKRSQVKIKENFKENGNKDGKWSRLDKSKREVDDDEDFPDDVNFYQHIYDKAVSWEQTFSVNNMDFHSLRSDWIDLRCNVSGNLLMKDQEALDVVEMYMRKLNEKHKGIYTLHQIVNIEKRLDRLRGSRYLLELELLLNQKTIVRLSEYIYNLNGNGYHMDGGDERKMRNVFRQGGWNFRENQEKIMLCLPTGFSWQRNAMIHFIVPVKNQARWVQQFIFDMEELYAVTGDENFNVIIADYSSTDMNVEKALKNSMLTRYQYVRLEGNFERSAGLQSGIDLIQDDRSIVFLCDLHISFPPNIIDSIRKHCVEGKMAFAPIVMRLNCGSSPQEPDGYWEMNGFGLLGIYKSDLDSIGGMNTKEFRDRWGGEDWELLDRIFQAGLEVERLYMRNFFHYYHSKRGMWNRKQIKVT